MGSYGIGVERVMACFIEQNNDEKGISWSKVLAPFDVQLIALNMKSEKVNQEADRIYAELQKEGFEVLYDDRDADLLGMPVQIIVGERKLKENKCEVKVRKTGERYDIELNRLAEKVKEIAAKLD